MKAAMMASEPATNSTPPTTKIRSAPPEAPPVMPSG